MAEVLLSPTHIGSSTYNIVDEKRRLHLEDDGDLTDIDDVTIEDSTELHTTADTTVSNTDTSSANIKRRTGLDTKRERPKSSLLDSPIQTLPESLTDFLKIPKQQQQQQQQQHSHSTSSPKMKYRKPFKNLTNLMSSFKKGLTRHTTVGVATEDKIPCLDHLHEDENEYELDLPEPSSSANPFDATSSPPDSPTRSSTRAKPSPRISLNSSQANPRTIRRIQSMYHTEKERPPVSMENNSILAKSTLNHFKVDNDLLPRIGVDDLENILMGKHMHEFDEFIIIDSRFQYEYNGGHIKGAINISSQQDLEDKFIKNVDANDTRKSKLVIFHCEFSIFRGPTMASHLRKCDRILNAANYPRLTYPDIVILEGGYKKFYDKFKHVHCDPQEYVEMKDINHQKACEMEMNKVRQASRLTRAKSYNQFGQQQSLKFPQVHQQQQAQQGPAPGPHGRLAHNRSSSYTTVTSHSENLKILKRQRSISKLNHQSSLSDISAEVPTNEASRLTRSSTFSYSQSIFNSSSNSSPTKILNSPPNPSNPNFTILDEDSSSSLQPPLALFKYLSGLNNRRSFNNLSSSSINSYLSISDQGSAFLSSDSLSDSYSSPLTEFTDFFSADKISTTSTLSSYLKHSNSASILNPMVKKQQPVATLPQQQVSGARGERGLNQSSIQYQHQFKFPGLKTKNSRGRLNIKETQSINTSLSNGSNFNGTSSPLISSPLSTITPASDSARISNISSIIDPINDTPVDFSVPTKYSKHSRRRSGLIISSGYNFITLDIDEIDEEDDCDGDGTLTDIKLKKNPFNN